MSTIVKYTENGTRYTSDISTEYEDTKILRCNIGMS